MNTTLKRNAGALIKHILNLFVGEDHALLLQSLLCSVINFYICC